MVNAMNVIFEQLICQMLRLSKEVIKSKEKNFLHHIHNSFKLWHSEAPHRSNTKFLESKSQSLFAYVSSTSSWMFLKFDLCYTNNLFFSSQLTLVHTNL